MFEAEVLTKLSVKDHLTLAQVNKECRDVVYRLEPFEFMRMCRYYDDSNIMPCRLAKGLQGRRDWAS